MNVPGKPAGPLVREEELDRALRGGGVPRAIATMLVVLGWPGLAVAAYITGPFSPAGDWYPIAFGTVLLAFVPLYRLTSKLRQTLSTEPWEDPRNRRKLELLEQVSKATPPVDVCTDCLAMFGVEHDGECPECRKKFTVMRVEGLREVKRLEVIIGTTKL